MVLTGRMRGRVVLPALAVGVALAAVPADARAPAPRTFSVEISGYVEGSFVAESAPAGPCRRVVRETGSIFVEWETERPIRVVVPLLAWFRFNPGGKLKGKYRLQFDREVRLDPRCRPEPQQTFDCGERDLDGGVFSLYLPKGSPDPNARTSPAGSGEDDLPPLPLGADSQAVRTTNAPTPRFRTCRDGPLEGDNDITLAIGAIKALRKNRTRTFRKTGTKECQAKSEPPLRSCRIEQGVAIEVRRVR